MLPFGDESTIFAASHEIRQQTGDRLHGECERENNEREADTSTNQTHGGALAMVTTLFFMWGFLTCLNDILVPHESNFRFETMRK